jgi:hypothetical protein
MNEELSLNRKRKFHEDILADLKRGVWLYILLLIFEGALRKWILPGFSNPLLLVRDPIAIWVVFKVWRYGLLPANTYLIGILLIGILSIFAAVLVGHGNLLVALYGARVYLIHVPMVFAMGAVFDRSDVIKVGKVLIWISIPMVLLIVLQYYSPQSAWVNRGIGGDLKGAGFDGAGGYFRPPGTFSFTNGNTLFFGLVAPFLFFFWLNYKLISRFLLIIGSISLIMAIPISISRTLFFSVVVSLIFLLVGILKNPKHLAKIIGFSIPLLLVFFFISQTAYFETSTGAFSKRLTGATESEGGLKGSLGDRYLGGMVRALTSSEDIPFFGYGIGRGTSVGGLLISGKAGNTIAEDEWGRVIGELGPLLGIASIILRLGLCIKLFVASYRRLSFNDSLPWLLVSFALLNVPQGQWAQPTALGFGIVIGGLTLASLRVSNEWSQTQKLISRKN